MNAAKKQEEEKVKEIQQAYTDFIKRAEAQLKRMYDESIKQYRNRMAFYIAKQEAAKTAEDYLEAAELFDELADAGDENARIHAEQCRRNAERIAKERADAKAAQSRKKRDEADRKNLILRIVSIIVCIIGIIISANIDLDATPIGVLLILLIMVFGGGFIGIKGIELWY